MSSLAPLPARHDDRRYVFVRPEKIKWQLNGGRWVDLYALLEVPNSASRREVEEAIVSRMADLLLFSVARGGNNEVMNALDQHREEYRPILLNGATRRRYDQQLAWHQSGDERAVDYADWAAQEMNVSRAARMARQLKDSSANLWQRFVKTIWESEYI